MNNSLKCTLIYICLGCTLLEAGYMLDYSLSEFSFYEENGFDRIEAPDYAFDGEPGSPELPADYLQYIIPPNAKVESLIITQSNITQIEGSYLIYPVQPPHAPGESVPWVEPDSLIYNSDSLFPGDFIKVVNEGIMDGSRIVSVDVRPLQYRPLSRRLFLLNSITFEFVFGPNTPPALRPQVRGRYEQAVYDAAIKKIVTNDHEIPVYYQKPTLVEENQIGALAISPYGAPGVIITPSAFTNYFQPYADWMTDQGIRTVIVTPQEIFRWFRSRDKAEQMRNYIIWCWQNAGGTYFILGGDDYSVPMRYGTPADCPPFSPGVNDSVPCDLYFADLTGNWHCDADDYWGELTQDSADCYSEVFVGRITALDTSEVKNWVTKVLHYEKTPGVEFDIALWINDDFPNPFAHNEFPSHFTHIDADSNYADEALEKIDRGYAFVNLNCHGNIGDFSPYDWNGPANRATIYSWWRYRPSRDRAGLNWLTNVNKYFFVYGISCYCGAYDSLAWVEPDYPNGSDTCIADAFVDTYLYNHQGNLGPFGACASILNTRSPLYAFRSLQTWFYDALFKSPEEPSNDTVFSQLGVAVALSKTKLAPFWSSRQYRHGGYCQNLFGSPVTEAWTKSPGNMNVSHPNYIVVRVETEFTVNVKDAETTNPLQYAKVCLNKPNDIYDVDFTDAAGQVTFTVKPKTTGIMKVTVTRFHNIDNNYNQYRPSQTVCYVGWDTLGGGGQASGSEKILPTELCITEMATMRKNNAMIKFGIPKEGKVLFSIYDVTGARVKSLIQEYLNPGYYQEKLDTKGFSNGIYFVVLRQSDEQVSRKFLFVR